MASIRLILLLGALWMTACSNGARLPTHQEIAIGGETWMLELALDDDSIRRGLMHRETIPDDGGMLFIFPDSDYRSFWMAYCLVDIDLIFLDGRGTITALHEMKIEPPRETGESELAYNARLKNYESAFPARFAIELPAGSIERLQLRVNQNIPLDLDALKAIRSDADRGLPAGSPPG